RHRPVVVHIDDLQWGDPESAERLEELLGPTSGPGIVLLGTCRTEERDDAPFMVAWSALRRRLDSLGRLHRLDLAPLAGSECEALARALLRVERLEHIDPASIARESGGSPFFVEELIRQAPSQRPGSTHAPVNLRSALHTRIGALPEAERRLLQLVAVAGQPVPGPPLFRAAGLGARTWRALDTLRAGHLVRTRQQGETLSVESYHDRIRETLLETQSDARRARSHASLARAMEALGFPDRGRIARHLVAAGRAEHAVGHALAAAEHASNALAFERAAELWALALRGLHEGPRRDAALRSRAEALVQCGRGAAAAPIFEQLADTGGDHRDLRRASEQWLTSGHVDRGREALRKVLVHDGLRWPASTAAAMAGVLRDLPSIALRRSIPRRTSPDPRLVDRVDTCWSAVRGLSSVDHVRGLYFVVRGMRLALAAGESHRLARIGMFFAAQLRATGLPGGPSLFRRYHREADRLGDVVLTAYADFLEGYVQLQQGNPLGAATVTRQAIERFEQECSGVGWEISIALNILCETVSERGDFNALAELAGRARRRAESLGDISGLQGAYTFLGLSALADDRPAEARRFYDELLDMWTVDGFHYPHFVTGLCRNLCDLYEGNRWSAWERMESLLPPLESSGLERSPHMRAKALARRASCGLAVLASGEHHGHGLSTRALISTIRRCARGLEKLRRPDGAAEVVQIEAALAYQEGRLDDAVHALARAKQRFSALELDGRVRLCALRRCQIEDAPARSVELARADVAALGVREPERWAAALAPGFERP
nr:hypothetical protein [Deltaproteobacteria bacterium]